MQDLKDLKKKRDVFPRSASDGEGNPLGCAYGIRGPKPYDEVPFFFVVRGPVPRDRWIARACTMARETRSPARMASEGPSPTMKGDLLPPRPREARRPIASRPGGLSYQEVAVFGEDKYRNGVMKHSRLSGSERIRPNVILIRRNAEARHIRHRHLMLTNFHAADCQRR